MNTLLRLAGKPQVESGSVLGPILHFQTAALKHTSLTTLLSAMRVVEETLVARYRDLLPPSMGSRKRR